MHNSGALGDVGLNNTAPNAKNSLELNVNLFQYISDMFNYRGIVYIYRDICYAIFGLYRFLVLESWLGSL